jgi:pimeloyl-ACP methyl ester carboxylesterase
MGDVLESERATSRPRSQGWARDRAGGLRSRPPRVVFLPGVLGSVLTDTSLTATQARSECETNLGTIGRLLRRSALYPCDKRPETLWGDVGGLHWLFAPEAWGRRMRSGNGLNVPGSVRATSLVDVDVRLGRSRLRFQPYAAFLQALRAAGADVLVFSYDWRLSIRHNAHLLQGAILAKWYGGAANRNVATVPEAERITFIGHSMGGLLARYFLESRTHCGWLVLRRLITIGTPHLGAPEAFLQIIGRIFPFPENPFYRAAQVEIVRELRRAGAVTPADVRAQFLPGKVQTDVLRFTASASELMPFYDFVRNGGRLEPFPVTYRPLVHGGTGTPALRLIQVLRNSILGVEGLEEWLSGRPGREYHLLGADGAPTVVGYERRGDRVVTGAVGDGRVPIWSARPLLNSTAHVHVKTLAPGGPGHQQLCERPDVQAYCLDLLRSGQRKAQRPSPPSVRTQNRPAPEVEDYVAMARTIMARTKVPTRRGVVLSITHLELSSGPPLVDATTEPSNNPTRRRLTNPPAHLSSRDVCEVESPRSGPFGYVLIHSNEGEGGYPIGGYLFLPSHGQRDVYLATFNVGPMDTRYRARCKNGHHAEIQLARFVEHQPPSWRSRIGAITVHNRSRNPRTPGYSPCNACCDDLARFLDALKRQTGSSLVVATLYWQRLYAGGPICEHPTTHQGLSMLRRSGWVLPTAPPTVPVVPGRPPRAPRPDLSPSGSRHLRRPMTPVTPR